MEKREDGDLHVKSVVSDTQLGGTDMDDRPKHFPYVNKGSLYFSGNFLGPSTKICVNNLSIVAFTSIVFAEPVFKDPNLRPELITEGLSSPTSMAFIDKDNILVLEKNTGEVRLVSHGILQQDPILKLEVDTTMLTCCRGLLGI